jgi:DNA repair protein RecO (recombination protein O)
MATTLYRATGYVLSTRDHREADRWYSAFTREQGKIEFLARGGRKPLAKLTPHLESPGEVELLIVRGKSFDTIAGVERLRAFPNFSNDTNRRLVAENALRLLDLGTRAEEPDPILYEELGAWFETLEAAPEISDERGAYLLASFALKLLAMGGYRPELSHCLSCKQAVASRAFRWHALKGGVVCIDCADRDAEQWFAARPMADETLKLLRYALGESFRDQLRPYLPGETLASFHEAVESLIVGHFPVIPGSSLRGACLVA